MMKYHIYTPLQDGILLVHYLPNVSFTPGSLACASSIYIQWWSGFAAAGVSCAAVFLSIAVLQYFQVPP